MRRPRSISLHFCAAVALMGAPALAEPPAGVIPLTDPGSWVTSADYPAEALRNGQEGSVTFTVSIGTTGQVTGCQIVGSSGSPQLDQATCDKVRQRARFVPATDAAGNPVAGSYRNRVRWMIPRLPKPSAGELVFSFLVGADGMKSDCRVESATGGAVIPAMAGVPCNADRFEGGYSDQAGNPVARRVRTSVKIEIVPAP